MLCFPVVGCDERPSTGSSEAAIAFAEGRRAYLVVDRLGVRMLCDPSSSKSWVLFNSTKRVGGIADFYAVRLLKSTAE